MPNKDMNKYDKFKDAELLKQRFENNFPFIYLGDIVKVSSRWAGGSKNPDEGKSGKVVNIQHGMQSQFYREYLGVTATGERGKFSTYFYALDLTERKQENAESFRRGEVIFLDDRIEIVDRKHPKWGATGTVVEIFETNGMINITANDESVSEKFRKINVGYAKTINEKTEERLSDEKSFSEFKRNAMKKIPYSDKFPEAAEKIIKNSFEVEVRAAAIKEVISQPDYVKQINDLEKELMFLADSSSVKMVERFPPNVLFRID